MMNTSKSPRFPIEPFRWEAADPLAPEHELVSRLVSETLKSDWKYYTDLDLNSTEAGRNILGADPDTSARLVLALLAHARYFDQLCDRVRDLARNKMERVNSHLSPEWGFVWPPRRVSSEALRRLMRRKLPLTSTHLIKLANWIVSGEWLTDSFYPLNAFVKAVESYGKVGADDVELRQCLEHLARLLRRSGDNDFAKRAREIDKALGIGVATAEAESNPSQEIQPDSASKLIIPAMVGSQNVLVKLKRYLAIAPPDEVATMEIGLDHFALRSDSSLKSEHEEINMLLPEVVERAGYDNPDLSKTQAGRAMLAGNDYTHGRLLLAVAERCVSAHFVRSDGLLADHRCWQSQAAVVGLFAALEKTALKFDRDDLFDLLLFLSARNTYQVFRGYHFIEKLLQGVESLAAESSLSDGERHVLHRLRCRAVRTCPFGHATPEVARLNSLLGGNFYMVLVPGEAWSDAVNSDLAKLVPAERIKWAELFGHASTATSSRPSTKWLKCARELIKTIGKRNFSESLLRWFPLINSSRTIRLLPGGGLMGQSDVDGTIHEDNATCLRGLVWMSQEVTSPELVRALGALTVSCYRKIPGIGPRAVKAGNAGVYALSQINDPLALGQLALLKVKVKFGTAQKEIEKAFNVAAERSGLPREELEEMSVPTYGLTDIGVADETMGDFTARLTITGTTSTELVWLKPDGKIQRAVPASVKSSHKEELKEFQAASKDIQKMLPAQRERIDGLFLQQKTWPLSVWRERYLNHPLVGTLARRILWDFKTGDRTVTAIWFNDRLVDLDLKPVELSENGATVQLWHPIGRDTAEITAWRNWLDAQQIQQPFKQAHREIYLLTDAERNTHTYSNRYAAHILKQHQFNALCALRGWKNQLRLLVDAEYPPATLHLPLWGLRAEFWVEGVGTDYGADTNDSGVYHYLSTDQVRLYRADADQRMAHAGGGGYRPAYRGPDAEPLPLDQIPALVFSEVMRDVDMFVGVASVGNDPAWADGGTNGRYHQYWHSYSFGELNASAKTRRDVLQRLIPKLKIADRCTFEDKFLMVKGSLRTYKIHLGSGNILMEPNDQYLCIVPQQYNDVDGAVLLPFEGDRTLSIILSKAFLLADDSKIKDPTILRQIKP